LVNHMLFAGWLLAPCRTPFISQQLALTDHFRSPAVAISLVRWPGTNILRSRYLMPTPEIAPAGRLATAGIRTAV